MLAIAINTGICFAQGTNRFSDDIIVIKNYDKIYEPAKDPIIFVGSSSIRKWNSLQQMFGKYNVINRGIGGAVIDDIHFYLKELVFDYQPRQIVIYVGENDLPDDAKTPDTILNKTKSLFSAIRQQFPHVPVVYIALKPSPVRDKYLQKCKETNSLIRRFISTQPKASFVDIFTPMLKNGKSRPELFVSDMLHMNEKGYEIWKAAIEPELVKP